MIMTDSQKWLILTGLFLSGWVLYLLAPIISPFLTAALLAYLCDPIVDRLSGKLPRTAAVILVFTLMMVVLLLMLLILVPLLQEQIIALHAVGQLRDERGVRGHSGVRSVGNINRSSSSRHSDGVVLQIMVKHAQNAADAARAVSVHVHMPVSDA